MPEPVFDRAGSDASAAMRALMQELFPICRSITGNGVRQTLEILGRRIPVSITEVATGTRVLDWTIPKEWNIRDAWIKDLSGRRVVDFRASNLHVVSYSAPIRKRMSLAELKPHLFSLPEHPDWIPYRTSNYNEACGFCVPYHVLEPYGEPQLGKRGLYSAIGGDSKTAERQLTMLWLLHMSDGQHSLLDIAEKAKITFREAAEMARVLEKHGLLQASTTGGP